MSTGAAPAAAPALLRVCAWEYPGCLSPRSQAPAGVALTDGICTTCAPLFRAGRPRPSGATPGATPPTTALPALLPPAAAAASLSVLPGGGGSRDSYVNDPAGGWRAENL